VPNGLLASLSIRTALRHEAIRVRDLALRERIVVSTKRVVAPYPYRIADARLGPKVFIQAPEVVEYQPDGSAGATVEAVLDDQRSLVQRGPQRDKRFICEDARAPTPNRRTRPSHSRCLANGSALSGRSE
jgi:hypothetical protein